jgi:hypothetical protein
LDCYPSNNLRECVQQTYTNEIGVRELTGNNDGVDVEKYLHSVKLSKGNAWCAAFVNWTLVQCNANHKQSGWASAWFDSDKVIFKRGLKTKKIPEHGDVFGIWFNNLSRIAHVGFVDVWGDDFVITVEGNTNGQGSRDGNGVYRKRRITQQIYIVADWIGQ